MAKFSKLKAEVRRHWRMRAKEEYEHIGEPLPADFEVSHPDDGRLDPPEPSRIARRASCLATVALRGLVATWDHHDQVEFLPKLREWFSESGLEDEAEEAELEVIHSPASELDEQSTVNSCWRWEGSAVLAASLGWLALPAHDEVVNPQVCGEACGLFAKKAELHERLTSAAISQAFDIEAYANRNLAIHWRLRHYLNVDQNPLDFQTYAQGVEWATFDLRGVPLVNGDLSVGGEPITSASDEALSRAVSIATERHHAANWLIGWEPVYSEVECPT